RHEIKYNFSKKRYACNSCGRTYSEDVNTVWANCQVPVQVREAFEKYLRDNPGVNTYHLQKKFKRNYTVVLNWRQRIELGRAVSHRETLASMGWDADKSPEGSDKTGETG